MLSLLFTPLFFPYLLPPNLPIHHTVLYFFRDSPTSFYLFIYLFFLPYLTIYSFSKHFNPFFNSYYVFLSLPFLLASQNPLPLSFSLFSHLLPPSPCFASTLLPLTFKPYYAFLFFFLLTKIIATVSPCFLLSSHLLAPSPCFASTFVPLILHAS